MAGIRSLAHLDFMRVPMFYMGAIWAFVFLDTRIPRQVFVPAIGFIIAGSVAATLARWWKTTYQVVDIDSPGEPTLVVSRGVLSTSVKRIPVSRVRRVYLDEGWVAKAFGLGSISVETEGANGTPEVQLPSIEKHKAEALRSVLLSSRSVGDPGHREILARPGIGNSIRIGLTRFMAGYVTIFGLATLAVEVIGPWRWTNTEWLDENVHPLWILPIAITVVVAGTVLAVARAVAEDWDLELSRSDGSIHLSRGLVVKDRRSIRENSIKSLSVLQGPLLRRLGLARLELATGGGLGESGLELIVGADLAEHLKRSIGSGSTGSGLAADSTDPASASETSHPMPVFTIDRAEVIQSVRSATILGSVLVAVTIGLYLWLDRQWLLVGLVLAAVMIASSWRMARRRVRYYRWGFDQHQILIREGSILSNSKTVPLGSVTTVGVNQSWFERRRGLATLNLSTNEGLLGFVTIGPIDHRTAQDLHRYILHQVEFPGSVAHGGPNRVSTCCELRPTEHDPTASGASRNSVWTGLRATGSNDEVLVLRNRYPQ